MQSDPRPSAPSRTQRRLLQRYGPWAVVTGATDGIGRECAEYLAAAGFHLVLVARRREVLDRLAQELGATHGIEARSLALDLTLPASLGQLAEATSGLPVGLLVAAAGFGSGGPFVAADLDEELAMIDLNCRAVTATSHHFARRFVAQGRGGLVLFSSLVAFQGVPRAANYAATKAFVQTLAEGLRRELTPAGVDVVSSAPGPTQSGFAARAGMVMGSATSAAVVARGSLEALGRRGTVRPGGLSKLLGGSLALLPRWARVRILEQVMAGMTRGKETTP